MIKGIIMIKKLIKICLVLSLLSIHGILHAAPPGLFFNIKATGAPSEVNINLCLDGIGPLTCQNYTVNALDLAITTQVPTHPEPYTAAGIKINTPGYSLAGLGVVCTPSPNGNGYCLFTVGNNLTKNIQIQKNASYVIGGSVSGLTSNGLVLQNNGSDNLVVPANASTFQFQTPVPAGGSYNVTILQQPTGLICVVNNGTGVQVMANVNSVSVVCSPQTFTIGGFIQGLTANGLILQNNAADNLALAMNASNFQFATPVPYGGQYNVTVFQQPAGLTCTVMNGFGTNIMSDVTNISIMCSSTTFTIGGTITGLTSAGLVLQNNFDDNLNVAANATTFQFNTPVAQGSSYMVTVFNQPNGLFCKVINGQGTNVMANVTSVVIQCNPALAYFTNHDLGGVTSCALDSAGVIGVCSAPTNPNATFILPAGIVLNSTRTTAYVANFSGNSVSTCSVDTSGALTACAASGIGLNKPISLYLNTNVPMAYIVDSADNDIKQCTLTGDTLNFPCNSFTNNFNNPHGIAVNIANTKAYVVNTFSFGSPGTIESCDIDGSGLLVTGSCQSSQSFGLGLIGIAVNSSETKAYVTSANEGEVYVCDITSGVVDASTCSAAPFSFDFPELIALNTANTSAYIANYNNSSASQCTIDGSGNFSGCVSSGGITNAFGVYVTN